MKKISVDNSPLPQKLLSGFRRAPGALVCLDGGHHPCRLTGSHTGDGDTDGTVGFEVRADAAATHEEVFDRPCRQRIRRNTIPLQQTLKLHTTVRAVDIDGESSHGHTGAIIRAVLQVLFTQDSVSPNPAVFPNAQVAALQQYRILECGDGLLEPVQELQDLPTAT